MDELILILLSVFAAEVSCKQTCVHYNLCFRRKVTQMVQLSWFSPLSSYGNDLINELNMNDKNDSFIGNVHTVFKNPKFEFERLEPIGQYEFKLCLSFKFEVSQNSTPNHAIIKTLLKSPTETQFLFTDAIPGSVKVSIPTVVCSQQSDPTNLYQWPDTERNVCVNLLCHNETSNPARYVTRCCLQEAWGGANLTRCNLTDLNLSMIESSESLNTKSEDDGGKGLNINMDSRSNEYEVDKNSSSLFSGKNFNQTLQVINEMLNTSDTPAGVDKYDVILSVVSDFVEQPINPNYGDNDKEEIKRIVERVALDCPLNNRTVNLQTSFVSMLISDLNKFQGKDKITIAETVTSQGLISLILEPDVNITYSTMVVLPLNLSSNPNEQRLAVYSFKDASLFDTRFIYSKVYTILVPMLNHRSTLTNNITFKFNFENNYTVSNLQCVFWRKYHGVSYWSTKGCTLIGGNTCTCNHLSSFSVRHMKLPGLARAQHKELTIISVVGCLICILALSATLFTYFFFKTLLRDVPSRILMYISVNLLIEECLYILSLAYGYAYEEDDNIADYVGCKVIAILLHYFQLASLAWMCSNAIYMYKAVTKVFGRIISMKTLVIGTISAPLVVIVITVIIDFHDHYGYQHGMCWLTPKVMFYSFAAPIAVMLLPNFYVFYVMLGILRQRKCNGSGGRDYLGCQAKGCASMMIMLGLSWTFAFISMGFSYIDTIAQVVFAYLFVITNSAEGFFIFVFYCWLKESAREHWTRFRATIRASKGSGMREDSAAAKRMRNLRLIFNGEDFNVADVKD